MNTTRIFAHAHTHTHMEVLRGATLHFNGAGAIKVKPLCYVARVYKR